MRHLLFFATLLIPLYALAELGEQWVTVSGQWRWTREVIGMVHEASEEGTSVAFCREVSGSGGAWRATVELALGGQEAGVWLQGAEDLRSGFLVTLGAGGFALKAADGTVLWEDRFAPWCPYQPYVLEGVVEEGRVRAQMLEWDGKTLVSQSPWVPVPGEVTVTSGMLGLYTREAIARFWSWEHADQPLADLTDEAPNKRRLVQDEQSPWVIIGPGNWMWTTSAKQRIRQGKVVERSSAIYRDNPGALRVWQCRLQVDPGAGGAGMLFQINEQATEGFLAWLGGNWGAGSLMLYRLPLDCLWSGAEDNWHYSTEYVLRAETRQADGKGHVRAQLLQADGATVLQETPWLTISLEEAARPGAMGFMTWNGTAEFWDFSAQTRQVVSEPLVEARPAAAALGAPWTTHGDGIWEWTDETHSCLRQTARTGQVVALNTAIRGIMGKWRCTVRVPEGTEAAGLVFQAAPDLNEGFVAVLSAAGFRLEALSGEIKWEDKLVKWERDVEYVLEGEVMTDRVAVRLLGADGNTVLSECPAVYVSETNNHRAGHLGVLSRGGAAVFSKWGK